MHGARSDISFAHMRTLFVFGLYSLWPVIHYQQFHSFKTHTYEAEK